MIKKTAGTKTNKMLATNPSSLTCMERKPLYNIQSTTLGYHYHGFNELFITGSKSKLNIFFDP